MKNLKFKPADSVIVDGKESKIKVVRKDFLTKKILYTLEDGRKDIEESKITLVGPVKPAKSSNDESSLLEKYKELYGKNVPAKHKNDEEWIKAKIAEKETPEPTDQERFEALSKLEKEDLEKLIEEKQLDIDVEDYDTNKELVVAICEELGIKVTDAE